ncbi:hypothetical protein B1R94_02450 [Mycolicibacterium litorale]|nr:hypothetical protein B1R94_02450 [Mycolicibacterium litorale]
MNDRAQLLVRLLAEQGFDISEDVAREDISSQVDLIAERMRIGRQAAKVYVTDEFVAGLAEHIARAVTEQQQMVKPRHLRPVPPAD